MMARAFLLPLPFKGRGRGVGDPVAVMPHGDRVTHPNPSLEREGL